MASDLLSEKQYHINCKKGDLPHIVLLPGDPDRVQKIGKFLEDYQEISIHREFHSARGIYKSVPVGICSTGIGGPSTAIAIEELARIGCDTLIRVGSTGAIQPNIRCRDLIINTGALKLDGTSRLYAPGGTAIADKSVADALITACENLGFRYHAGICASTDSFYIGQGRPGFRGYLPPKQAHIVDEMRKINVINFEMENSTIFTICGVYGLRAGSICAVFANRIKEEFKPGAGEEEACMAALEAVRILER